MSDWEVEPSANGGIASIRVRGTELDIRFAADRLAYTEAKSDFIEAALLGQKQA